ncbi:hypothetical protein [Nocardioides sp. CER19]|uniref:hypothetical protein n=1 Tax=Nocardioides sp. CER19 TaxID=3038538 RepID=UPI00244B11C7|nr:hypothetical protein [Nocardioides sp. CER19]MDH2413022.1 hypothetical protein [Nocardioides sp. CER19]
MSYEPIAAYLAVRLTQQQVLSARPDAPVVPDKPRPRRVRALRTTLAADLHRVAAWLEPADPCPVPAEQR